MSESAEADSRDVVEYESDSDWSPADEFEGLDDVEASPPVLYAQPDASVNVPRSTPCQKPVGNVIIQDGPMPEPSSGGSKQYQSPTPSIPTEAIEFAKMFPNLIEEADNLTAPQIMIQIKEAMQKLKRAKELDHWISDKGQAELKVMNEDLTRQGLNIFDYAPSSKASLCPMTAPDEEWYEVELTADTGACDTVVPKLMCPGIPITPSVQSLRGMEYEVATGESIPNLARSGVRCGLRELRPRSQSQCRLPSCTRPC